MKTEMTVEGFTIKAWKGPGGIMRLEVTRSGREVLIGLNSDWESRGVLNRISFTDNPVVIGEIAGDRKRSEDHRPDPKALREAWKDPGFRVYFNSGAYCHEGTWSALKLADEIEAKRREEGRDPSTGILLAKGRST